MSDDDLLTKYGNKSYVRAVIGSQFDDPKTYEDILKADGGELPYAIKDRGTYVPKGKLLPYQYYYDRKYIQLENEKIWKKKWQVACREEDIPEPGDRISYDVGTLSFLIVHSAPGEFKAFYNSCRHRARRLCGDVKQSSDNIQCPFHAWTYDLNGKLQWVPRQEEFPGVSAANFSLREVKCDRWGGNIFINPDPDAPPLDKVLGVMVEHFKDYPTEQRYTAIRLRKKVRINWKSALEAFLEGYHVLTTHPSGMPIFGSTYTAIDVWDDGVSHVSRLITPLIPDGWIRSEISTEVSLQLFCNAYGYEPPPADRGHTVCDLRAYAAEAASKRIKAESGIDFSDRPVAFLVDMAQWFSFPNFFPWWGEGLAWWYNFLPLGDNPDESIMEIRLLKVIPANGERPPAAKVIEIGFDDQGRNYPETGQVGYVMDEDMENMEEVHKGMKAARDDSARPILSRVQEARVRHFQEVYADAMGIGQSNP